MSRSFTDPIAQVVIEDLDTGKQWHWGSPDYPFLTSVTFAMSLGMTMEAYSIGIDMPYEYGMQMLDINDTPFKQGNLAYARIGYAQGGWTDWVHGFMKDGGKTLSVTPEGVSGSIQLDVVPVKPASYSIPLDLMVDAGYDAVKFLELLGGKIGFEVEVTEQATGYLNSWKLTQRPRNLSFTDHVDFYAGLLNLGIWDAMRKICKENNCTFFTVTRQDKKKIVVHTERDLSIGGVATDENVSRKYVIRGILDPSRNQYPAYSFTPDATAGSWERRTPTAAASGVNGKGLDTETGEDVEDDVEPQRNDIAIVGSVSQLSPVEHRVQNRVAGVAVEDIAKKDGTLGTFMSGPIRPGGLEIFRNQAREFQKQGDPGLKMEIATIGIPEEKVGNLCQFFGGGALFASTYLIEKIKHSWGPGSWDMALSVFRKGEPSKSGEHQEPAGGQMPR